METLNKVWAWIQGQSKGTKTAVAVIAVVGVIAYFLIPDFKETVNDKLNIGDSTVVDTAIVMPIDTVINDTIVVDTVK